MHIYLRLEDGARHATEIRTLLREWFHYDDRRGVFDWNPLPVNHAGPFDAASFAELRVGAIDVTLAVSAVPLLEAGDDLARLSTLARLLAVGSRCLSRAYCTSWLAAPESVWYNGEISNKQAAPLAIAYGPASLYPLPAGFFTLYGAVLHADAFHRPIEDAIGTGVATAPSPEVTRRAAALQQSLTDGVLLS